MVSITLSGESRNPIGSIASLDMPIAVGFGDAYIQKGEELVFMECDSDSYRYLQEFEDLAVKDPDHAWKCVMNAPLWNATWKRKGTNEWVCVESGMGFA